MKPTVVVVSRLVRSLVPDALILGGVAAIGYGAWLVYVPAGWMVGGLFALSAGVLAARKAA